MVFSEAPRVALIEDDDIVRQATSQWLQLAGFHVNAFSNGVEGKSAVLTDDYDAIVSDVRLPDIDGLTIFSELVAANITTPLILITGHGDVDMAVKALQNGVFDFIEKPFQPERLSQRVQDAVDSYRSQMSVQDRQDYLASISGLEQVLIGQSDAMVQLREQLVRLARIDTHVIIYGETGSGKELVATSLHNESPRHGQAFVPINCGAIPENLFESELFGHEAGAFTGASGKRIGKLEYADKGTLFFDEIESMPLAMQVKVLRSIQENTVERIGGNRTIKTDLRVIAAAKEDLSENRAFRQDLYYRLNVAQIHIPPLRERDKDTLILFEHFASQTRTETRTLSDADRQAVLSYAWPGNVRELRNVAVRFALDDTTSVMEIITTRPSSTTEPSQSGVPLAIQLHNFERKVLSEALARHRGCISDVLLELDIPRRTLNQKMQKLGLNRADFT
ncbi:sigma-54-dependent transcriptional regulator [Vibrio sp. 10N.261.51.F12]|uniref:sigma-54-dependent transcriptional regulator n=1 Tax=Vibrio sp. 10N.261.51.F12 TaxID=3229679 RepID=UPI00354FFA22